ncbi:hypothetical protein Ddye_013836 [Dipteronia dyeriana]|uniref:non-specific serine/threonine protein kinase n=1 Tax=Dipteronia dyeriana TaxID=168575 RepID=A0AAE0CK06_9ROSI|nr:hypothetical protein Ddye_013836 [Dipteronia dyeriana]
MSSSLAETLSKHTSLFGLRLWILILTSITLLSLLILIVLCLFIVVLRRHRCCRLENSSSLAAVCASSKLLLSKVTESTELNVLAKQAVLSDHDDHQYRLSFEPNRASSGVGKTPAVSSSRTMQCSRFAVEEMEAVTSGFAEENVIGSGDNGVVYRGILLDVNARVAVKKLLSNSSQAEDFITEVEAIGQFRHKNLVKLVGYCVEGYNRMLVYEYIDNGNLHQWLHGGVGQTRPLSWSTRLKIIQGIAKGLTYLHEDIEQKMVHQNIKSSNILLDHQWNPKISDVGLAKLHSPEWSRSTHRQLIEIGYLATEDASTCCVLNEKSSDVYSFGILIMVIITGRMPVDHSQPQVHLVEWLKSMVANQKIEFVLDPKMPEFPSSKELKRIVLISLRCVDPDVEHRPKMGEVIHMLEPRDLLLDDVIKNNAVFQNSYKHSNLFDFCCLRCRIIGLRGRILIKITRKRCRLLPT